MPISRSQFPGTKQSIAPVSTRNNPSQRRGRSSAATPLRSALGWYVSPLAGLVDFSAAPERKDQPSIHRRLITSSVEIDRLLDGARRQEPLL